MIAYRVHFEPHNVKAIELCRTPGDLGKLPHFDHHRPLASANRTRRLAAEQKTRRRRSALVDVGIYGLNATRYLTGEEHAPTVSIHNSSKTPPTPRFTEVEEGMVWTMKFPSGVLATCTTSYNIKNNNHHRLMFENGVIDMEPATGYHGIKMSVNNTPVDFPEMDQFAAQMDHLADCITTNTAPRTPGEEGLRDHKIMAALYESARTNKTVTLA